MFKFFTKFLLINLISLSMISSSQGMEGYSTRVKEIAQILNSEKITFETIAGLAKETNPTKALEIEEFLKDHPEYKDFTLPKVSLDNNKLTFVKDGTKVSVVFHNEKSGEIVINNKKIELNSSMTVKEMFEKLSSEGAKKEFSVSNFFIEDANALGAFFALGLLIAALGVLFLGLVGGLGAAYFENKAIKEENKNISLADEFCQKLKTLPNEQIDIKDLESGIAKMENVKLA
ncbi:MAG: hypothetical protein K2Q18_14820, partial [Bdellovibrionales bacterium]|nr:hypothetical protein [Bdellovibrionales bacterium]